ncbi:biotin-dependent carboxyltransferase family protein [Paenibacillus albiflavus]|uniref:Biotin-dependent carboxyltransferase family protein n=1 Tax=Paenibacillus albiflavus TaxID=2545760 RepID=A0A4R4E2P7_9BACL|nr:biotin-dependent carboxyltransferase family protein [Paenibacillus albiflavus]TCZ73804.1 biotin-dependent carboxyltransferase family protein [Paenibacillus albiflavus]
MSVEVITPGLNTTVQDLGRYGYQQQGVSSCGAMDDLALQMANLLVGNSSADAVLEITMQGPHLLFLQDMLIAICGGDFSPTINGNPVSSDRTVWISKGSVLQFGFVKQGCRAYLAVAGGWDVPIVMGSRSTDLRAGFGGFEGRRLKAGDHLRANPDGPSSQMIAEQLRSSASQVSFYQTDWFISRGNFWTSDETVIRVIRGDQFEQFSDESRDAFFSQTFQVSPQSDRMGYRLSGPTLSLISPQELISAAVAVGTIQVPPNGQPIILMADRQTIGGYPKIGYVASADLAKVAQFRPGQMLRFEEISPREAQKALYERNLLLRKIKLGMEVYMSGR